MNLRPSLLELPLMASDAPGEMHATHKARGLYNYFQFGLRLSPEIHRKIEAMPSGIVSSGVVDFEGLQAFSTYLHETIHWWQHIGSTYGLMVSLSYPSQAQANYNHLKELVSVVGFAKPIRSLAEQTWEAHGPGTPSGLANTIINNSFDISSFRALTLFPQRARDFGENPLFESVGHSYSIAYGNNALLLGGTSDPDFGVVPHPKHWEPKLDVLRNSKREGFYLGSPIRLPPVGGYAIFEGQARFCQMQYIYYATGGQADWSDMQTCGMLEGVYVQAFEQFLAFSGLKWPTSIGDPIVGLFLLVCDMSINPGSGFPFPSRSFETFIEDIDPGRRFIRLSRAVTSRFPNPANAIRTHSRDEYEHVSRELADAIGVDAPLTVAQEISSWITKSESIQGLHG